MATHAYIRPGGVWNFGVMVTHAEFAAFDAAQVDSISASGGTYSPVAPLIIGGAGIQVLLSGTSTLPNGTTLAAAIGSAITVAGTFTTAVGSVSTFNGSASFSGSASFNGVTSFTSNANFVGPWGGNGALLVSGTASFTANPAFSGNPVFSGAPSIASGGQLDVASGGLLRVLSGGEISIDSGAIAVSAAPILMSGAGRVVKRVVTSTSSAITTIGPHNCDVLIITSLPSSGFVQIDDTGAQDGDELRVVNLSSTHLATVQQPDGVTTILSLQNTAGSRTGATFMRVSGTWQWIPGDAVN